MQFYDWAKKSNRDRMIQALQGFSFPTHGVETFDAKSGVSLAINGTAGLGVTAPLRTMANTPMLSTQTKAIIAASSPTLRVTATPTVNTVMPNRTVNVVQGSAPAPAPSYTPPRTVIPQPTVDPGYSQAMPTNPVAPFIPANDGGSGYASGGDTSAPPVFTDDQYGPPGPDQGHLGPALPITDAQNKNIKQTVGMAQAAATSGVLGFWNSLSTMNKIGIGCAAALAVYFVMKKD